MCVCARTRMLLYVRVSAHAAIYALYKCYMRVTVYLYVYLYVYDYTLAIIRYLVWQIDTNVEASALTRTHTQV